MKKFLNVVSIILGIMLITVCVDLTTNKLSKTDYTALNQTDREAIAELCSMTELFKERRGCEDVWCDNYNLRDYKAVITRKLGFAKGYTYAVNMSVTKNIFAQQIKMPDEYSDIAVYRFAYLTPFTFKLSKSEDAKFTEINGERVFASVYDTQSVKYNGSGSMEDSYVKDTFYDAVESLDVPARNTDKYEISEENVALTGLQYRILDDMLIESDDEKFRELVREYIAVREYQNSKNLSFSKYREQTEAKEGCAQYAFYNVSSLIDHNITYFNKEKDDSITFYSAYYYICTGRYNSDINSYFNDAGIAYEGAALCRVVEDHEMYDNWQMRVDASENDTVSPYTLIKRRCERNYGGWGEVSLDDVKRAYNYEEIISMARALVNGVK